MAKKIFGRVVNDKNEAVEFATVFLSDANGKPIGNVATNTDDKGRFVFNSLNDTDYVTGRMVGLKPTTVSVKSAVNIPSPLGNMPTLAIKMPPSEGVNLQEVVVKPREDDPKPPKPEPEKPKKEEPKKGMSNGLKIGLIVGGSILVLTIIAIVVIKSKSSK